MAKEVIFGARSFQSSTDLSATSNMYKLVKLSATEGMIQLVSGTNDRPVGVLVGDPKDQQAAPVVTVPGSKVKVRADGSGTTIAIGDFLGSNTSGMVVKVETDNFFICAQAEQGCATEGMLIEANWLGVSRY